LTSSGKSLCKYSNEIIQAYNNMVDFADDVKGCQQGHLTISVASTANYFASRIISAFSKCYPDITISMDVTNRQTILQQLQCYEPDLAVMGEPPEGVGLMSEELMPNPLVIIAPTDHPLKDKEKVTVADLQGEKFVVREKGSGTQKTIEKHFASTGLCCTTTLEMSSNEAIKQAVSAGFGLGVVSYHTIDLELKSQRLIILNVEGFPLQRYWHLVAHKEKAVSPVADAFKVFLRTEAKHYVSSSLPS
jgi:DNA-binding transcriptional LysR family regulator